MIIQPKSNSLHMPKACNVRSNFSSTSALRKKGRSNLLALTPNTPYPPSSMWLEAACSSISAVSVYPHLSSSSSPPGIITLEFQLVSVTQSHVKSRLTSTIGVAAIFGQFHLLIRHLLLVVFRKQHVFDKFFASLIFWQLLVVEIFETAKERAPTWLLWQHDTNAIYTNQFRSIHVGD